MTPDFKLLARYASEHDEAAFAELVQRHLGHVYSTALRLVGGDLHLAEDVAQAVFTDLAHKAGSLGGHAIVSGWLYASTRFTAANVVRTEQRRRRREQYALTMPSNSSTTESDWDQVRAFLDDSIGELNDPDRDALMLRYFEKKPLADVGAALGVSEDAARMRVDRAIDKLRTRLTVRGITSTAAALGTVLAQNLVGTAPTSLASRVTARALATACTAGTAGGFGIGLLTAGKLAMAIAVTIVIGMVGLLTLNKPGPSTSALARDVTAVTPNVVDIATPVGGTATPPKPADPKPEGLVLVFVDAKTGVNITNHTVTLTGRERGSTLWIEKPVELDQGRCVVPFAPEDGRGLWVGTHVEGYADVRLRWQTKRGDTIPESYTVGLIRPALIHGRVLDPGGNPVAGATVRFGTEEAVETDFIEDHCIHGVSVATDSEGKWQMSRLAPDLLEHLSAGASHPEFAESKRVSTWSEPEAVRPLLDGSFVFRLTEGIVVRGVVMDPTGHPIGQAMVRVGQLGMSGTREARTEADGAFTIRGCDPSQGIVTAEADGFAANSKAVVLGANSPPVQITLAAGRTLRFRVVDTSNKPICGALVTFDSITHGEKIPLMPQVEFESVSDGEGRVIWENAPDRELKFQISASGYACSRNLQVRPDDEEHVVVLAAGLIISGTVRDSVSGALLPEFRLGLGWPERNRSRAIRVRWFNTGGSWATFSNGQFHHTLGDPAVIGSSSSGYVFRFEAAGHKPFVTRVFSRAEGEVHLDIKLIPADGVAGTIYTPEGRPAQDAQIAMEIPGSEAVGLVPGALNTGGTAPYPWIRNSDVKGGFVLPPDDEIKRVIVVHPDGYAEKTLEELNRDPIIRLDAWSHIEGVWQEGGQPRVDREVVLLRTPRVLPLNDDAYKTRTDEKGGFVYLRVPAGRYTVFAGTEASYTMLSSTGYRFVNMAVTHPESMASEAAQADIELQPGESKRVFLGDVAVPRP